MVDDQVKRALEISRQIQPMLAGLGSDLQGAILADLTAMWLAGHIAADRETTQAMRKQILDMHIEAVRDLIKPSEQELLAKMLVGVRTKQ
jgi:hypothetical protein